MSRSVVVFDLDDTLFAEREFVLSGFAAVDAVIQARFGRDGFLARATTLHDQGVRGTVFNQALLGLRIEPEPKLLSELLATYRSHPPRLSLLEDARWALDFYRASRRLALITDGYLDTQRNKVRALGVENLFEKIVYSDAHGRAAWKPSAVPYEEVMKSLGCSGQNCVYIADNPTKDFVTARRLGWATVRIRRDGGEYAQADAPPGLEADAEISTLYSLKELDFL